MYLNCTTEKTANQQKCFENALIELLKAKDIEYISVVEICERAGITRRIFYRLFETKYDCLVAAIDHKILALESYKSEAGYTDFMRMLEYVKKEHDFFDVMNRNNHAGLFMDRVFEYTQREHHQTKELLELFGNVAKDLLVFNISGFVGLLFHWSRSGYERSIEEMAMLLEGLINNPAALSKIHRE